MSAAACCSHTPEKSGKIVETCCGVASGAACCGTKPCTLPCSTSTGGCCDLGNMKLKVVYFNVAGRAELVRWMLAYAKAPFEDFRVKKDNWAALKKNYPTEQLPILEYVDPKTHKTCHMVQSSSIVRAVAGFTGLAGKTPTDAIEADQAYECLRDIYEQFMLARFEKDATRKEELTKKLKTDVMPRMLGYLEKKLLENHGKFLSGNSYTYGDFAIAVFVDGHHEQANPADVETFDKTYPTLVHLAKVIRETAEIKAYLTKRPESEKFE